MIRIFSGIIKTNTPQIVSQHYEINSVEELVLMPSFSTVLSADVKQIFQ